MRAFGHIYTAGKDPGYIGNRMLKLELPGKRKRGRPQRRFTKVVRANMQEVGVTEEHEEDKRR